MSEFYSYLWLRADGTPYYAGKGCGNRAFIKGIGHRQYPPKDRSRILIFPMLNETEAFESEMAMIELFGRKDIGTGCLRNVTNGGEGISGYRHTTTAKMRMSEARIGNTYGVGSVRSPEFKANLAQQHQGKRWSADAVAKRVATRRAKGGFGMSPESRAKESLTKFLKTVAWG